MSKQCKIVEDLLPLYHDGVCSQESRQMVEEHLAGCENCKKLLGKMDVELVAPTAQDVNIKPLESINKMMKKGKRKALVTGISIALTVVLVLFAGMSIWWYTWEYTYYKAFVEGHDPYAVYCFDENGNIVGSADEDFSQYTWYDDTYRYHVEIPGFLSGAGTVDMDRLDCPEGEQISVSISRLNGTKYVFCVSFTGDRHYWVDENGYHHWPNFMVDSEMNQYYMDHWSDETIAEKDAKLEEYEEEVRALINDAIAMWPFIK